MPRPKRTSPTLLASTGSREEKTEDAALCPLTRPPVQSQDARVRRRGIGVEGGGGHGIDPCSRFFRLPGVFGVLAFHASSSVDRGLRLRDFAGGHSVEGTSEGRGPAPDDTSDALGPLILTGRWVGSPALRLA